MSILIVLFTTITIASIVLDAYLCRLDGGAWPRSVARWRFSADKRVLTLTVRWSNGVEADYYGSDSTRGAYTVWHTASWQRCDPVLEGWLCDQWQCMCWRPEVAGRAEGCVDAA